ncbi:Rpn family recombination-promoting nuclease/putative transposase [Kluyvera ascorbata]|uniref:Rpn family recombination-promoting nuclease/putative transposase n=1 Tax=Kluyvera ascorbata TaxID=51288 RepID=UPI003CCC6B09
MNIYSATPHDAIFKQFLRHKAIARDFLQAHLPGELLAQCKLETLQLASGSFADRELAHAVTARGAAHLYATSR